MRLITGGRYQGKSKYAKKLADDILLNREKEMAVSKSSSALCLDPVNRETAELIRLNSMTSFYESCRHALILDHCEVLVEMLLAHYDIDALSIDELSARLMGVFEEIIRVQPEMIFVMAELGCGVVPIDRRLDCIREQCGRISYELAARAVSVDRLTCGIPQRIAEKDR